MAAPDIPAAPQSFTFAGLTLFGLMTSFTGADPRRHVVHQFIKRRGARVEDMQSAPRTLDVVLQLLGESDRRNGTIITPQQQFVNIVNWVNEHPTGLLVHPIAGKWQAFCHGPSHDVNFARGANQISVRVQFTETQLDAPPLDIPDPPTAAQKVTHSQQLLEIVTATIIAEMAKFQKIIADVQAKIDKALEVLALVEAPIDFMQNIIATGAGTTSDLIHRIDRIVTKVKILLETIDSYLAQATSAGVFFTGNDVQAGGQQSTSTLLGNVETAGQDVIDEMISSSPQPATCADAVAGVEAAVAACIVLADALKAARPPIITFTVPVDIDLLTLCQVTYKRDAESHASQIQTMNRIPNPALIPSGTKLLIPSR